jgi:hypothetical protein
MPKQPSEDIAKRIEMLKKKLLSKNAEKKATAIVAPASPVAPSIVENATTQQNQQQQIESRNIDLS